MTDRDTRDREHQGHEITIIVNNSPHHVEGTSISADGIRELAAAPADYEVWQIIHSPDPEGQLPVDDKLIIDTVEVKNGDRFRVVPRGTFGC